MAKTPRAMFLALSMGVILLGGLSDANAAPASGVTTWKTKRIEVRNETGWPLAADVVGSIDAATVLKLPVTSAPASLDGCHPVEGLIRICFASLGATAGWGKTERTSHHGDIVAASVRINSDTNPFTWPDDYRSFVVGHEVITHAVGAFAHDGGGCLMSGCLPLPTKPDADDAAAVNAAYGAVKALSQP